MVMVIEKIQLPALEAGVLSQLNAREGQFVAAGSIIAKLDDSRAATELESSKLKLEASQLKVSSDIAIKYAQAAKDTAMKSYKREEGLFNRSAASESKVDVLRLEAIQAGFQLEKASHDYEVDQKAVKLDEIQVTKAQQLLNRYTIQTPWNGVVSKVLKHQNEWVDAGDPILELVQMERIWIEGSIDPELVHPYQVSGKNAEVVLTLPGGEKVAFEGQVNFVDTQVVGSKYKVRAEVLNRQHENYWLLIPGMYVNMDIVMTASAVDRVSQQ
jgi:macrolide-specific efflux system membrane fusion protein